MNLSGKSFATVALAILVAGAGVFITNRQSAIAKVRADNEALLADYQEAAQLSDENKQIERLRAENQEVKRLEAANEDLLKLRNDAMQLRHQMDALNKLKAENADMTERLTNRPVANVAMRLQGQQKMAIVFQRENLQDKGTGFPMATLQTVMWAICTGNFERFKECFTPEGQASFANATDGGFRNESSQMLGPSFTGYEVVGRESSGDEISLTVQLNPSGQTQVMRFKNMGGDWKLMR